MKTRGFTLIELLFVISIIGLLASIILTSLSSARSKARIASGQEQDASIAHSLGAVNLIGEWNLDETSGTTAADSSGDGLNGTINGDVTLGVAGIQNTAFTMDGSTGYILVPTNAVLSSLGQPGFTVTAWIKPALAKTTAAYIVSSTNCGFVFFAYDSTKNLYSRICLVSTGNWATQISTPAGSLLPDEWQFVALTYDGANENIYIDGSLKEHSTADAGNINRNTSLYIGSATGGVNNFDGSIDEVRAYSSSLTADAVSRLYAEGAAAHDVALK